MVFPNLSQIIPSINPTLSDPRSKYLGSADLVRKVGPLFREVITRESTVMQEQEAKLALLNDALDILGLGRLLSYEFDHMGSLHSRCLPANALPVLSLWFDTFFLPLARATSFQEAVRRVVTPNLTHCFDGIINVTVVQVPVISENGPVNKLCSGDAWDHKRNTGTISQESNPFIKPVFCMMGVQILPWERKVLPSGEIARMSGFSDWRPDTSRPIPVHPAFLAHTWKAIR